MKVLIFNFYFRPGSIFQSQVKFIKTILTTQFNHFFVNQIKSNDFQNRRFMLFN